jgi:hypothetical protein
MTNKQFMANYKNKELVKDAEKAITKNCIDLTHYEKDNYLPIRLVMSACLKNSMYNVRPLSSSFEKEIENIYRFI